ncbi:hypothetical protein D0962_04280 [Leptolyngbyaceae cyanobacterium CCMR0082]|uniref:Terminase large subunit gp17-like C-terminal domain-containing protein n=1 Tax=Adonisia turfae CCMR0082 TaxID=2304604 RepID=A0A6M0S0L1_9CYAN|nr:terminase family protein [Adonisia turfae]NEZ61998.1 hypothetical protein [Adonisia turfae CCMR0082]
MGARAGARRNVSQQEIDKWWEGVADYFGVQKKTLSPEQAKIDKPSWPVFASKTLIRSGANLIPFQPYDYQKAFVEQIEAHYGTVAVKSRQMGFTEMVASYFLWSCYQNPAYLAVIFSKTQDDTTNIARRVRMMASSHPDVELETENLRDLKLKDGGRLVFKPATPNAARGLESVAAILFDEAAFVPPIEEIYGSAMPSMEMLGDDARVIILSTPNGQSGFYWERVSESNGDIDVLRKCEEIRQGGSPIQHWTDQEGWCKFMAHWRAHPVYSNRENYLQDIAKKKRLPLAQVRQEYDLDFTVSTESLFNQDAVQAQAIGQWEKPQSGADYLVCVDPNFGGSDYFRAQVWKLSTDPMALVAEYAENQRSIEYSKTKVLGLIDAYRPVLCAVESNSGGVVIIEDLAKARPSLRLQGVLTTNTTKRVNTDRIAIALEQKEVIYPPDWAGVQEMPQFSALKREASSGHDDTITAWAAGWAALESAREIINSPMYRAQESTLEELFDELGVY